jgi:hypothetical protein
VANGSSQRDGVNFNEFFSHVMKHSSICMLFAMIDLFDLELEQFDVKMTFLRNELIKTIYACISHIWVHC